MYNRWYSQSVHAESLFRKLRKGTASFDVDFKNVFAWVGIVVGIIAALYLLLVLALTAANNENNQNANRMDSQRVAKAVGMGVGFCVLGGGLTLLFVSNGNRRLRKRVFAFDDAIQKYDFKRCGNELIEGDYGIPLFHSVELPGCPGKRLWGWLCGKWKKDEFAWLQGGQLVDPVLRTFGDNQALNIGIRMLGGRHASRENRLRQAGFEAIVFSEELNLPDIILGHQQIFETSYIRKEVQEYALPLPGMPSISFGMWGAVSDQRGAENVYPALADIFNSRRCLIQVIGGHVVVFLNSFIGWESELVGSLDDVERELDFAHSIFQRLKLLSQATDPSVATQPDAETVAAAFKSHGSFRPRWGMIVSGLCMLAFGGLGLLGAAGLQNSPALEKIAKKNIAVEQVDARVTKRGIMRGPDNSDGSKASTARPWISYSYKLHRERFNTKENLLDDFIDIDEARKMARSYRKGQVVQVWADQAHPEISSLDEKKLQELAFNGQGDPGAEEVNVVGVIAFAVFISLVGLGLVVFGFISGRHKVVVPDFANQSTRVAQQTAAIPASDGHGSGSLQSTTFLEKQPTGMLD